MEQKVQELPVNQEQDSTLDISTINRSAMSRALKVDIAHVSRVLSGKRKPSFDLAVKISQYLGVSLDALYALLPRLDNHAGRQGARQES